MRHSKDNILLITYHPLKAINGGTKMYENILRNLGDFKLFWIATGADNKIGPINLLFLFDKFILISSFIFKKNWLRVFTKFPFVLIHVFFLYFIYTPFAFWRIKKMIKVQKIELVWIETFKQTYLIAYLIQKFLKIRVHLSFNDHYTAHAYFGEGFILRYLFMKLIRSNASFDLISEGMLNFFKENYFFNSDKYIILWLGGVDSFNSTYSRSINNKVSRIIFYGSIHGFDTMYKFCDSVKYYNTINNEKICLDIYSEMNYSFFSKKYNFVNYLGSVNEDELKSIIVKYDLVYVPMYFDVKNSIIAKTSISSKMILAINSNIPIFSHGPIDSANSIFVTKNNIGINCNSLNINSIIESLTQFNLSSRTDFVKNQEDLSRELSNIDYKIRGLKKLWKYD
jgi:hypothetical protein